MNERPFDLLNKALNKQVLIRLKNGVSIRGRITSFDAHMNVVIEDAEELEDKELKASLRGDRKDEDCSVGCSRILELITPISVALRAFRQRVSELHLFTAFSVCGS